MNVAPEVDDDALADRVRAIVAQLPPLSDEQCSRVAALLRGSA